MVVIESGSMMRCDQGLYSGISSTQCDGPFGRIGTIDPGDLVFVKDTDGGTDIQTTAACLEADDRARHGGCGDTIIYRPGGSKIATPIIHRAILFLVPHPDGSFDVPACDLQGATRAQVMANACVSAAVPNNVRSGVDNLLGRYTDDHAYRNLGPDAAGFITLGDNNPGIDQGSTILGGDWTLIQPEWVLGKARGELPWLGLLKLWFTDATGPTDNFARAPSDTKVMMWISLAVLIGGPTVYETIVKRRRAAREDEE